MPTKYGPTINIRKLLYLKKSNKLSQDIFGITMLFMIDPEHDSLKKMTKQDYKRLFAKDDQCAMSQYYPTDQWLYQRGRRMITV